MKNIIVFLILVCSNHSFSSEIGRYQIITSNNLIFLLDTMTGKIWTKGCVAFESKANPESRCAISAWLPHEIVGMNASEDKKFWKGVVDWESAHP